MKEQSTKIVSTGDGCHVFISIRETVNVVHNGIKSTKAISLDERDRIHKECNRKCAQKIRDRKKEELNKADGVMTRKIMKKIIQFNLQLKNS